MFIWGDRDQPLRSTSVALPEAPRAPRVLDLPGWVMPTRNFLVWRELPGALVKELWEARALDLKSSLYSSPLGDSMNLVFPSLGGYARRI